jgi:aconitate hydratase
LDAPIRTKLMQVADARILLLLGDCVTTDHISPAGPIPSEGPAADYLRDHGIASAEFNTYAARRGNHEVMTRGAFTNPRLENALLPGGRGGRTRHFPDGTVMSIFDAAARYRENGTPLVILAGKDYGGGSSRDWAAKATALLGVQAVIAESFERIHRANLVAVGVLPLQFMDGTSWRLLGLDGSERLSLEPNGTMVPLGTVRLTIERPAARPERVMVLSRVDTASELASWRAGGLLPLLLRKITARGRADAVHP